MQKLTVVHVTQNERRSHLYFGQKDRRIDWDRRATSEMSSQTILLACNIHAGELAAHNSKQGINK